MVKLSIVLLCATLGLLQFSSYIPAVYGKETVTSNDNEDEDLEDWTVTPPPPKPFNPLIELTEDNYDETIDNSEYILVEL